MVGGDPVNTADHIRDLDRTVAFNYTNCVERNILSNAVSAAADSTGNVSSVAKTILSVLAIIQNVDSYGRSSAKIRMRCANAGIDHVCMNSCAGSTVGVI